MDKQKLIQECLEEIGVKWTDKEQTTRALLEQLYDKKPQDITDTKFIQNLLIEIQKRQKRKKKWIFWLMKRYRSVLVTVSLSLLVVIWIWSPWNDNNSLIDWQAPQIIRTINEYPIDRPLSENDAISTLMYEFEELLKYQDNNAIPPKSIRTQKSDLWRLVAFIIEGSWRKTIISAECYKVLQDRTIIKIWNFKLWDTDVYDNFDISICK